VVEDVDGAGAAAEDDESVEVEPDDESEEAEDADDFADDPPESVL
jgi:hypothetical protein